MALGAPIFVNMPIGAFVLQESSGFDEAPAGEADSGVRILLTRAETPRSSYPVRGATHPDLNKMFVQRVSDRLLECRLVELTVLYSGYIRGVDGKPHKLIPGCDTQLFTLPAIDSALNVRWVAPVPQPTLTRHYVTFTQPTLAGVGSSAADSWLPAAPSFSLTFTPDPDEPLTRNYYTGWRLISRTWPEEAIGAWPVTELYAYFNTLA